MKHNVAVIINQGAQFQFLNSDSVALLICVEIGAVFLTLYLIKRFDQTISDYRTDCALCCILPLILMATLMVYWVMEW